MAWHGVAWRGVRVGVTCLDLEVTTTLMRLMPDEEGRLGGNACMDRKSLEPLFSLPSLSPLLLFLFSLPFFVRSVRLCAEETPLILVDTTMVVCQHPAVFLPRQTTLVQNFQVSHPKRIGKFFSNINQPSNPTLPTLPAQTEPPPNSALPPLPHLHPQHDTKWA